MTQKATTKIKLTCNILIRDNNLYIYIYDKNIQNDKNIQTALF